MTRREPDAGIPAESGTRLRLLTFNMQAGASTGRYREYVTRSWQHLLPHPTKGRNLALLSRLLAGFDVVALQEADAGSLRSGFDNQTHVIAEAAGFPWWTHQTNRRVARLAESCNGVLMRHEPSAVIDHRLPGASGRGALEVCFGGGLHGLRVFAVHLSLTPRARRAQIDYLAACVARHPRVVMMGDFNCTLESPELAGLLDGGALRPAGQVPPTFPSWRPRRAIDHILVSDGLEPLRIEAPAIRFSDHLPVALEVELRGG